MYVHTLRLFGVTELATGSYNFVAKSALVLLVDFLLDMYV